MTTSRLKFLILSWDNIFSDTIELARKIKRNNFKPDVLVAVLRGGAPIARILSDILDVKLIATVQAEFYADIATTSRKVRIIQPLSDKVKIEKKNVLIVDDVADTGETLVEIVKHVKKQNPKDVKVACLHIKPWTKFIPDFYVKKTNAWIVYPWEYFETIRSLKEKLKRSDIDNETRVTIERTIRMLKEFLKNIHENSEELL